MPIRIIRNEAGNCVTFRGTSVPAYFNACLSGEVDSQDNTLINVKNDIRSQDQEDDFYEFSRIPYTDFEDRDGNTFENAQSVADYITSQGNVLGLNEVGKDLTGQTVNFRLDQTSTSIIMDNGEAFGVNTIKAVTEGGLIKIKSIGEGIPTGNEDPVDRVHFEGLDHTNVQINGVEASGGLNDVVNAMNELFTVGAFEAVVISDPYSTMIADIDGLVDSGSLVGSAVVDPIGNDVGANTQTHNNNAGYLSSETIDQAGEYFTFDIRGEGQIGFGLVHTQYSYDDGYYSGNATYANPSSFCNGTNSSHYGYQFAHFFHPTPNGSWTNYGANTAYSIRPGWNSFPDRQNWIDGNPVKMRVGIDVNGYISIDSYDPNTSTFVPHSRTTYIVPEGAEFKLGIKFSNPSARLYSIPKVHLLEPAAPTMYFRYIESPDGNFHYPLFATEEEANYYDSENGGSGASHTHVYTDDPTNTTWYMPETNGVHNGTSAPSADLTLGTPAIYTEITSLTNADQVPPAFTDTSITVDELSTVNYQLSPVDVGYVTTIGGTPNWSVVNGTTLTGTAPEVTGDNVANPSDTTTVTVYRTNSYGTSQGTLTINITNLTAPVVTPITGVTHEGGTAMIDSDTMDDGTVISIDNVVDNGNRFVIDKEWLDNYVLPKITSGTGSKSVWIGFEAQGVTHDYTAITNADFRIAYEFNCDDNSRAANNWRLKTHAQGSSFANVGVGSLTSGLYDYVFINEGATLRSGALVASQGHNASTKVFDANSSDWNWTLYNSSTAGNQKIIIATQNTDLDLDLQYFSEYTEPTAPTILTNWNKALDFSGNSERAQQVSSNSNYMPIAMDGLSATASAPTTSGNTSGHVYSRPWATAVVFKADGNNSNQHIWNQGEGAGSSDDNIYLRMDSNGQLYFGWGRQGALNECALGSTTVNKWYGVYIAHNGTRLSGSNATAANLAAAFDIRITTEMGNWTGATYNYSQSFTWSTNGGRMDRSVVGNFTVGGRGANRNFHGKVASFVSTTLRINQPMPNTTEIELMITDPKKWLQDYKDGQTYRVASSQAEATFGLFSYLSNSAFATQVWLMGDGNMDNYSNMIRNQVYPNDQNYTKLNLISMVSNDIQTVNINGLT